MSLSEAQLRGMARLTFEQPYTMQQLADLIKSSYREVYDFFRTRRSREYFNVVKKPWVEVLENASPKLSKGKRSHYKKWVRDPNVWVRLAPKGFDLITARANLKPKDNAEIAPKNRQQARRQERQTKKSVFQKLNYPQQVLDALAAGELDPTDLPARGHPGSGKYRDLVPDRKERSEVDKLFRDFWPEEQANFKPPLPSPVKFGIPDIQKAPDLPAGWTAEKPRYVETVPTAHGGAFGADGLPEEGEPLDLPYSYDLMLEQFNQDMYKKFEPFKLGKCGPERREAVLTMIRAHIKNFGYTVNSLEENGKRKFIPNNQELFEFAVEKFQDYLFRTTGERLVLLPKDDPWAPPVLLPNANRFNNEDKRAESRIRFENIFNDASRKYKNAIMLTLTSGQWHDNIFDDVKKFQENWNKLITRLRKEAKDKRIQELIKKNPEFLRIKLQKTLSEMPGGGSLSGYEFSSDLLTPHTEKSLTSFLEAVESFQVRTRTARRHEGLQGPEESDAEYFKRIKSQQRAHNVKASELRKAAREYIKIDNSLKMPYLCVREFQRNGNVHYHVIIFGIRYLKHNDEISQIWQQYGQGKITKINKIRWSDTHGYTWDGRAPDDSSGRQPMEYLKKYLLKGQYANKNPEAALLYWVFNSRFYTYSSSLLSDEHKPRPYISKGIYEFAGVLGDDEICVTNTGDYVIFDDGGPPLSAAAG